MELGAPSPASPATRRPAERWLIILVLLVAAALRLTGLLEVPPGLQHDEVANWLIDREILAGRHALYFTEAYGHEAGFHYIQSLSVALIGDSALALRLPTAFAGILVVAIGYALVRQLFGPRVGLIQASLVAVLLWPVFFSRFGIRAMSLPVVTGLAAWFFWRGLDPDDRHRDHLRSFALGGVLAGLSLYTYFASRAVPLIFGLLALYLALAHRPLFRRRWQGLALSLGLMVLVAAPLGIWLLGHPAAETRVAEVSEPLVALRQGDPRPILDNVLKMAGFFGWQGDPRIRHNLPGRPVLDPVGALLFYGGLLLALSRWRRPAHAFAVLWLAVSLAPSLVTIDAPSSIRCVNALLVVGVFPGLAVESIHEALRHRPARRLGTSLGIGLLVIWLAALTAWTVRDYFGRWAPEPEVAFVWQSALRDAAVALDAEPALESIAVAGWTPDTMDPPTMALYLRRDDLALRFFNPTPALVIPAGDDPVLVRPAALPLDPILAGELLRWQRSVEDHGTFVIHRLRPPLGDDWLSSPPVPFDGGPTLLGYRALTEPGRLVVLTIWEAAGPQPEPLRIFLHALDAAGTIAGQHDGLGTSASHWMAGDLILQLHPIALPPGKYTLELGLYNPETNERLVHPAAGGPTDTLILGPVAVP
jgi:4-amino-4-deoxy-L-arabinose transferase-like glycosyltransferase